MKTASPKGRQGYFIALSAAIIAVVFVAYILVAPPNENQEGAIAPAPVKGEPSSQDSDKIRNDAQLEVVNEEPPSPPIQGRSILVPPSLPPTEYNSLPTGTRIEDDVGTSGHGKLIVENGTSGDAVVRLSEVPTEQTVRWFFVQAHSTANLSRIPQGRYRLTFTTGLNWVESEDTFSWQPSYSEFERTFEYNERRDSDGIQYKTISVTLNPVLLGNVRTKTITREEFLKGHRHLALQR